MWQVSRAETTNSSPAVAPCHSKRLASSGVEQDLAQFSQGAVHKQRNPVVSSKTLEIEAAFPHVQPLLRCLELLGSSVVWAHRRDRAPLDDHGIVLIRFSGQIESQFGLTREVALVVVPFDDIRYQMFADILAVLRATPRQVSEHVILVSSLDPREQIRLDDWSTHDRLAIGVGSVQGDNKTAARTLAEILRRRIYSRNPYAVTAPVQGDRAFFGRQLVVQEMFDSVVNRRPIALVGLRKAGKTSLLKETALMAEREFESAVVLKDLESLPQLPRPIVPDLVLDLVQDLGSVLEERNESAAGLRALPDHPTVSEFRRALKADLKRMASTRRLVLALDEIEYMCPPAAINSESPETADITQFLGCLRSLVQETENFSFFIAGLTPDIFRRGMLFGSHNPLFSWVVSKYVRPFTEVEAGEMLQSLGSRMGLAWDPTAIGIAISRAGGHVFMVRNLGAVVANKFDAGDSDRTVTAGLVTQCIPEWLELVRPNIQESIEHVERYYEPEFRMLSVIRQKGTDGVKLGDGLQPARAEALNNLIDLGLVVRTDRRTPADGGARVRAVDYLLL